MNYTLYVEFGEYSFTDAASKIYINSTSVTQTNIIFNGISLVSNNTKIMYMKNFDTLLVEMSSGNDLVYKFEIVEFKNKNNSYTLFNENRQITPIIKDTGDVNDFIVLDSCKSIPTKKLSSWKDILAIYQNITQSYNNKYFIYTQLLHCQLENNNNARHVAHFGTSEPDLIQADHNTVFMSGGDDADYYVVKVKNDETFSVWVYNESNDLKLDSLLVVSEYNATNFKAELSIDGHDLKLVLSENSSHQQTVMIINYADDIKYRHIFFMDLNRTAFIPKKENNNVVLLPFYIVNSEQDTFIISSDDLNNNEVSSAVIDIQLNSVLFDKKENHLLIFSKNETNSSTLSVILQDFYVNFSYWKSVNIYSHHKGKFEVVDLRRPNITNYDDYAHDQLMQAYDVQSNGMVNYYNINDTTKLSLFTFHNMTPDELKASTNNQSITLFDKNSKTLVHIEGFMDKLVLEFKAGLRPIRVFLKDYKNDYAYLQYQINNASIIYNNMKNYVSYRLDTIMSCVMSNTLKDDRHSYIIKPKSIFQEDMCAFSMNELNSLRADKYIEIMLSRATILNDSNNFTTLQLLINDVKENVVPVVESIAARYKLNVYLEHELNKILPSTVYVVASFLKDRCDKTSNCSIPEKLISQILIKIIDDLEKTHSYLTDNSEYQEKIGRILNNHDSSRVVTLLILKAYNEIFANVPNLYDGMEKVEFDSFKEIVPDEFVNNFYNDLSVTHFHYQKIINLVENYSIIREINKNLVELLSFEIPQEGSLIVDSSLSDDSEEEYVDYDENASSEADDTITQFIDQEYTAQKKSFNIASKNVLTKKEDSVFSYRMNKILEHQNVNDKNSKRTRDLKAVNALDLNGSLILAQFVSHKLYGKNETLNTTRYLSPESERQIALNQSASEVLPLLQHNDSVQDDQKFRHYYENSSQWYKDMYKDKVKKMKVKQDYSKSKKVTNENY